MPFGKPHSITQNQPFIEIQVTQIEAAQDEEVEAAQDEEEAGSERDGVTTTRIVDCDDDRRCSGGGNLRRSCRRRRDKEAAGCDGTLARAALQRRDGSDGRKRQAIGQLRYSTDERRVKERRPMGQGARRVMLFLALECACRGSACTRVCIPWICRIVSGWCVCIYVQQAFYNHYRQLQRLLQKRSL
jgi:hypothetical protein